LEDLEDNYSLESTPTEAYELDVELTTKGSDDRETEDQTLTVAKVDGEWYIIAFN
jgi:hypothetical protein